MENDYLAMYTIILTCVQRMYVILLPSRSIHLPKFEKELLVGLAGLGGSFSG